MIKAVLVGGDRLQEWLKGRYPEIQNQVGKSMARLVIALTRKIKQDKLTGQVLKNRTGTLRRSISPEVGQSGTAITGSVGTNIIYARAHEYGVTTRPHDIYPRKARALAWMKSGFDLGEVKKGWFRATGTWTKKGGKALGEMGALQFARVVHHPGSVIPERSFMRTALKEMEPEIRAQFKNAIMEVIATRS